MMEDGEISLEPEIEAKVTRNTITLDCHTQGGEEDVQVRDSGSSAVPVGVGDDAFFGDDSDENEGVDADDS